MKTEIKKEFIERGYGQFPYIIVRQFTTHYSQIPLKRRHLKNGNSEGIFIDAPGRNHTKKYEKACKLRFHKFWADENKKGTPLDICLVLNENTGYYISKKGEITEYQIPSGGILKALDNTVIAVNSEHYIVREKEEQDHASGSLKVIEADTSKAKKALSWGKKIYKKLKK
jgi:hypothetical protein